MMSKRTLEDRALDWIADYSQAEHLVRTRDWILELDPGAGEAMRLAALTHDIERYFPGGPKQDRGGTAWDDAGYIRAHCERSAEIVGVWLRDEGADDELAFDVEALIRDHELGGPPEADLLQAADSISFLETLAGIAVVWVRDGICSPDKAKEKHTWMYERIRPAHARRLAAPYYESALAAIDLEVEALHAR